MRLSSRGRKLLFIGVIAGLTLFSLPLASATLANVSKSYKSAKPIAAGNIVSLSKSPPDHVELANAANSVRLLGVAAKPEDSLLAMDAKEGTVQVVTTGTASVLVTDLGGEIKTGDQIGVSPFEGVGMRNAPGLKAIGLAQTSFNSRTKGTTQQRVTDTAGNSRTVRVGYVRVHVAPINSSSLPEKTLQNFSASLTGHPVSSTRIGISLVVILVTFATLITLTYGAIYGSIISVGRNPLGAPAVFHTLRSVLGMVFLVASVGAIVVFMLLR